MNRKPGPPAADEAGLFEQFLDGVIPLAPSDRIVPVPAPRRAIPRNTAPAPVPIIDKLSDHGADDTPPTEFMRSGISRMTLRKLRRGAWPVQDSLDLHGLNSDSARKLLLEFLQHALHQGHRCICVVHGKGWHSGGVGILKSRARHWLTQCPEVLAFCEAPPDLGGGGAVLVLLKNI